MTITIPYEYTIINMSTMLNGDLKIEVPPFPKVYECILKSVYEEMNTEDFIKTLDYDQIQEISEYFETIKDKK